MQLFKKLRFVVIHTYILTGFIYFLHNVNLEIKRSVPMLPRLKLLLVNDSTWVAR